ncbi:MAG: hypothetical protein ACOCV8_02845, partial [Spirochaetota bacterium]
MMWADDKLEPEEIELWKNITGMDLGLSDRQRKDLEEWFKEGPNLNIIGAEIDSKEERIFTLRQAMLMSMIDGEVDEKEIELIKFLKEEFEIEDDEFENIEKEARKLFGYS